MNYPIPHDEEARLAALREYAILDTLPEQAYDDITLLASQICGTPIALVSLVDDERQWFKSRHGLDAPQMPREQSFWAHALNRPYETFVIPDATQDERFRNNALVTGAPNIRFYAGAPLLTGSGHALGTLCVIDSQPRQLSKRQLESLGALSRQVMAQMELRRKVMELDEAERSFNAFMDNSPAIAFIKDASWRFAYVNQPFLNRFGLSSEDALGKTDFDLWPQAAAVLREHDEMVLRGAGVVSLLETTPAPDLSPDGERFWQVYKFPLRWHGERVLAGLALEVTENRRHQQQLEQYQSQLEAALARVEEQSVTDSMTGLRNRRAFERRLAEEFERFGRYQTPLSLLLLDVDKFKSFNDTFGHQSGDETLQMVSRLLQETARTCDFVARYGGEEFVVILPNTEAPGALVLAERFRCAIEGAQWPRRAITISVGAATVSAEIKDAKTLLGAADKAMYAAKAGGRNRVAQAR